MKTYKHLVFDIDGTIIDSAKINMLSLQETVKELRGDVMPLEDLYFSFGIPGVRAMEILGFPEPEKAVQVWIRNYSACAERLGMPLFPGMREILERLREKGASLGIITSKLREEYDEHFEKQGLLELFPCVVTASDTPKGKCCTLAIPPMIWTAPGPQGSIMPWCSGAASRRRRLRPRIGWKRRRRS